MARSITGSSPAPEWRKLAVNVAMSNDLYVQSIAPARSANNTVGESIATTVQPSPQPAAAVKSPPLANPSLHFDSMLGLVVIEFSNDAGVVTTQVPSQRQLDAYQRWNLTRLGPAPPGQSAPPTPVSASPVAKPEVRATPAKAIGV